MILKRMECELSGQENANGLEVGEVVRLVTTYSRSPRIEVDEGFWTVVREDADRIGLSPEGDPNGKPLRTLRWFV